MRAINTVVDLRIVVLVLCVLSVVLNGLSFQPGHDWGGDFCHYIAQSQSLVNNSIPEFEEIYRFIREESLAKPGPIFAPWGLPVLYAPISMWQPNNIMLYKWIAFLFLVLAFVAVYFLSIRYLKTRMALILLLFICCHPSWVSFKENIQSDTVNLLFHMSCLLGIRLFIEYEKFRYNLGFLILLGIALYFSFLTKTIGVILTITFGIEYLIRLLKIPQLSLTMLINNWREYVPFVIFCLGFLTEKLLLPDSHDTYSFNYEHGLLYTVIKNAGVYSLNIMQYVMPVSSDLYLVKGLRILFFLISLACAAYAIIQEWNKTRILIIYLVFYFMVLLPLPFHGGGFRYLLPVYVVYLMLVFQGIQLIYSHSNTLRATVKAWRMCMWVPGLVITVLFLNFLITVTPRIKHKKIIDGPYSEQSEEMFSFIRQSTPDEAIILFFKPRVMHYFTARYSYRVLDPRKHVDTSLFAIIDTLNWDYIVQQKQFTDIGFVENSGCQMVFDNEEFFILKRNTSGYE